MKSGDGRRLNEGKSWERKMGGWQGPGQGPGGGSCNLGMLSALSLVCTPMHMQTCAHVCGDQRTTSDVLLLVPSASVLRQGLPVA